MLLALLVCERPDELRADLMECYGVALRCDGTDAYAPEFVAALAAQLPPGCRWRVSYDSDAWWTAERVLQADLVNLLSGLVWAMGDRRKRGPAPKPIGPSWLRGEGSRTLPAKPMGKRALLEQLSKPRKEG